MAALARNIVCRNNQRKYYRFRPSKFYGGIATADCVGSLGCNFRCPGCQNWDIAHWKDGSQETEYLLPEGAVELAIKEGCIGISWTFNEPTLWLEYTVDSAKLARAKGLYTNYVTNGFITEEALYMIAPFLDVYRIDIKGFSDSTYSRTGHIKGFQGILYVYLGNVPGYWWEDTYCHTRGELLIERYIFDMTKNKIKYGKFKGWMSQGGMAFLRTGLNVALGLCPDAPGFLNLFPGIWTGDHPPKKILYPMPYKDQGYFASPATILP